MGDERAEEERARLFVALELPEEARQALGRWRSLVLDGVPGLRALPEEQLHVTLCFLGWRSVSQINAIADACGRLSPLDPPTLRLGQARWLPPRRPRVLAVELQEGMKRVVAPVACSVNWPARQRDARSEPRTPKDRLQLVPHRRGLVGYIAAFAEPFQEVRLLE